MVGGRLAARVGYSVEKQIFPAGESGSLSPPRFHRDRFAVGKEDKISRLMDIGVESRLYEPEAVDPIEGIFTDGD